MSEQKCHWTDAPLEKPSQEEFMQSVREGMELIKERSGIIEPITIYCSKERAEVLRDYFGYREVWNERL